MLTRRTTRNRNLTDRFVVVAVVLAGLVGVVDHSKAQTSSAMSMSRPTPAELGFLTSYRFHLDALGMFVSDERFVWDTDVGADLDVFDLRFVRGNVLTNFESIIGEELRPIDPNQFNYTVDLSVWWRLGPGRGELGPTFHHVSRHLGDRDKEFPIAWNLLGLQYVHAPRVGEWDFDLGLRALWKLQRSFVDYAGEFGGYLGMTRPLVRWTSLLVRTEVTVVPVAAEIRGRDTQTGSRVEVGLRFRGGRGVGEVFMAGERRIDADPLAVTPTTFTMLGFRFRSP